MKRLMTVALALATTNLYAQNLATEVAVTEAAPGVYMLAGANGFSSNIGLVVGDDKGRRLITDRRHNFSRDNGWITCGPIHHIDRYLAFA